MWHPPIGHQLREYTGCDRFYWLSAASGSNQYNCEIINFLDYTALSFACRAFAIFLSRLARVAQQKRVCDLATAYFWIADCGFGWTVACIACHCVPAFEA